MDRIWRTVGDTTASRLRSWRHRYVWLHPILWLIYANRVPSGDSASIAANKSLWTICRGCSSPTVRSLFRLMLLSLRRCRRSQSLRCSTSRSGIVLYLRPHPLWAHPHQTYRTFSATRRPFHHFMMCSEFLLIFKLGNSIGHSLPWVFHKPWSILGSFRVLSGHSFDGNIVFISFVLNIILSFDLNWLLVWVLR